jgi:hypothetical protein
VDITIRPMTSADIEHVIAIPLDDPQPDVRAIVPDLRRTRAVGTVLARHGLFVGVPETVLAVVEGRPVGLLETLRSKSTRSLGLREGVGTLAQAIRLAACSGRD